MSQMGYNVKDLKLKRANHIIYEFKLIKQLEDFYQKLLIVKQNNEKYLFSSFELALIDILTRSRYE